MRAPTIDIQVDQISTKLWLCSRVPETEAHLIYNVNVWSCRFVVHTPAAIDELESSFINELANRVFSHVTLLLPPLPEKSNFHVDESVGISSFNLKLKF